MITAWNKLIDDKWQMVGGRMQLLVFVLYGLLVGVSWGFFIWPTVPDPSGLFLWRLAISVVPVFIGLQLLVRLGIGLKKVKDQSVLVLFMSVLFVYSVFLGGVLVAVSRAF